MGRHELDPKNSISVAYGHDHATGYFLSVTDHRLAWSSNASKAINAITEKVNPDGGGCYFDLHTGPMGFGHKADVQTLAHFWGKYGVPQEHIQMALQGKSL
jgi:hypothetical protein